MSRFICSIFLMVLIPISSLAQRDFEGGLTVGVIGSQMSGDGLGGFDKVGFQAGAYISIPLGERLAAQMEMYYIAKGSQRPQNSNDPTRDTFGYRFNYIEVPILLDYKTDLLNIEAGAYFGVLTSSKLIFNNVSYDITQPAPEKSDIGFIIGAKYDLTEKVAASLRYSQSLVPVRDFADVGVNPAFDGGMYHSVLHLTMRYKF